MDKERQDVTSIIIAGRDKFSPTVKCIDSILKNTPESHEIIVVLGGCP